MRYTAYFEQVAQDPRGGVRVEAEYEFDGVFQEFDGFVDRVSQAHTKLRQFRQEFRNAVDQVKQERKQSAGQEQVASTH